MSEGISVVIPSYRNAPTVENVLGSLRESARHLPGGTEFEVILVDDSPRAEADRLHDACAEMPGFRYLRGPRLVPAKRNIGARAARFPKLVFLDSDCSVSAQFLDEHARALDRTRTADGRLIGAIAGPVRLAGTAPNLSWRIGELAPIYNPPIAWPAQYSEVFWACTMNFSMRREIFEAVGAFHEETFTHVGGEDLDLCMRLRDGGYTIACAPNAWAEHAREHVRGVPEMLKKMYTYGRSEVYSALRQPHYQSFHANPVTFLALWSLALAAGRSRRPVLGLAALALPWWAWDAARLMRRKGSFDWHAIPAVALEWAFDLGIAREAVRRGVPAYAFQKFRYFDSSYFRPLPAPPAAEGDQESR